LSAPRPNPPATKAYRGETTVFLRARAAMSKGEDYVDCSRDLHRSLTIHSGHGKPTRSRNRMRRHMRFTRPAILDLIFMLFACSQGTGILPAGPDTYTVTEHRAPILGGASEAQRVALTEANDYCANDNGKNSFHSICQNSPPCMRGDRDIPSRFAVWNRAIQN
jgi:hypothetical protein